MDDAVERPAEMIQRVSRRVGHIGNGDLFLEIILDKIEGPTYRRQMNHRQSFLWEHRHPAQTRPDCLPL